MKTIIILLAMILAANLFSSTNDGEENGIGHIAPDFLGAYYDHFSNNLQNIKAAGMGATGVTLRGGIESAVDNPAAFKVEELQVYLEANVKGAVDEMNRYVAASDPATTVERQKLDAPVPAMMIALGGAVNNHLSLGASFSIPQSIRYNVFGRMLRTGAFVDRYPEMYNYQTALSMSGHLGDFSLGLNVIHNYYTFRDLRVENTFDRLRVESDLFRFQPGLFYQNDLLSFGMSYKTAQDRVIRLGNVEPSYQVYDHHFPAVFDIGAAYQVSEDVKIALAFGWEQTSEQYEGFDDRLTARFGVEKSYEGYDLRAGLISIPGVYEGAFAIPETAEVPSDYIYYPLPYDYGIVGKSDQLILTAGLSFYFPNIVVNGAIAKDLLQNVDLFQVMMSLDVNLGKLVAREDK